MSTSEILQQKLYIGNRQVELGDWLEVIQKSADNNVTLEGDFSSFQGLGRKMQTGTFEIHGNVGHHAGAMMTGGALRINGQCSDFLGAEMRSGTIHVRGSAGDYCGSSYIGSRHGMRGGEIRIGGSVGAEAGRKMRRGLLMVHGNAGEFFGSDGIAGTCLCAGEVGPRWGTGLKRSTLIFLKKPRCVPPGFRGHAAELPTYFDLLRTQKQLHDVWPATPRWQLLRGDWLEGGFGEVWHPAE